MYKFLFFLINTFQFFLKSLVSSLVLHISTLQRPPVSLKSFISITQHVQCHTSNNQPTKKKKIVRVVVSRPSRGNRTPTERPALLFIYKKGHGGYHANIYTPQQTTTLITEWTSKTTGSLFIPFTTNEVKLKQHWYLTVLCAVLL